MIIELKNGGEMIFVINYKLPMSVHPVALYDAFGSLARFPTGGLTIDPCGRFPYMITSVKPLMTRSEVDSLVETWVNWYVDTIPVPY